MWPLLRMISFESNSKQTQVLGLRRRRVEIENEEGAGKHRNFQQRNPQLVQRHVGLAEGTRVQQDVRSGKPTALGRQVADRVAVGFHNLHGLLHGGTHIAGRRLRRIKITVQHQVTFY